MLSATVMAKPLLIATDIIKAAGRGNQEAVETLQQSEATASPAISVLTEISLSAKCENEEQLDRLLSFLSRFDVLPMDLKISRESIKLRQQHGLSAANSLIAATAIVHGRSLVTANQGAFEPVEELNLEPFPMQ